MKEGYKITEVGEIPKNWEAAKLSSVCEKISVGFVGTCEPFYVQKNEGVLMLRTGNLSDGKIIPKDLKYVSHDFHLKNTKSRISAGDLLVARHGDSGQAVLVPVGFPDANCLNIVIIRPGEKVLGHFLKIQFNSFVITNQIKKKTAGSTQGVINTGEIASVNILIPPLNEQTKISKIISAVDEKIEIIDSKINQTQKLKKGLMEQLLTKGIGHTKFKESPLGKIPQTWKVEKLENVCLKITDGSHYSPIPQKNTGYLIATVKDMKSNCIDLSGCAHIREEDFEMLRRNGCNPIKNDILFSKDGTIGKTFVFDQVHEVVLLSSVAIIRLSLSEAEPNFIHQTLMSHIFYNQLEGLKSGSAIRRLVLKAIKEIKVVLPPLSEQKKISEILITIDKKLEALQVKKDTFKEMKKGLTQQLLTGNMRVKIEKYA